MVTVVTRDFRAQWGTSRSFSCPSLAHAYRLGLTATRESREMDVGQKILDMITGFFLACGLAIRAYIVALQTQSLSYSRMRIIVSCCRDDMTE
jgi:hypothetical protein